MKRMTEVTPQPVEWLWQMRIPKGELILIEGDPQTAKSLLTVDLAARVSTGRPMPDGSPGVAPTGTLILSGEDSISKTLFRRLKGANADMERIGVLTEPITLPDDLSIVEKAIDQIGAGLLVIDPITMFLGRSINNEQSVREALSPLRDLAERTGIAVVLVRHLAKRVQQPVLYRGAGSIGVIAATRSAFMVVRHPANRDWRVLCHTKSNLGPLTQSLLFQPTQNEFNEVCIDWIGAVEWTPEIRQSRDHQITRKTRSRSTTRRWSVTSYLGQILRLVFVFGSTVASAAEWGLLRLKRWFEADLKNKRRRRR